MSVIDEIKVIHKDALNNSKDYSFISNLINPGPFVLFYNDLHYKISVRVEPKYSIMIPKGLEDQLRGCKLELNQKYQNVFCPSIYTAAAEVPGDRNKQLEKVKEETNHYQLQLPDDNHAVSASVTWDTNKQCSVIEFKCTCGSDSVGGGLHSSWCDKYEN